MPILSSVWVFNGAGGQFPAGVFTTKEIAEAWIGQHKLTGCLTRYPVDQGFYDWAVENNHFKPKTDDQKSSSFIQTFSCAYAEHYHYENGVLES